MDHGTVTVTVRTPGDRDEPFPFGSASFGKSVPRGNFPLVSRCQGEDGLGRTDGELLATPAVRRRSGRSAEHR